MDYEFQLRREAMKLCREQGYSIQAALLAAYRNQERRMKHWFTLFSIASNRCDTTSDKASREVEQLREQVAQLQKSRSPRGAKGSRKSSRGPLAQKDSAAQSSNQGKGGRAKINKGGGGKGKSQHTAPSADLLNKVLHKHNKTNPGFCFPFQSGSCSKQNGRQHHNCAGCDKVGVPYKDCLCLAHF